MVLLAPAALALAALLAGPILAHLSKRQPRERRPFGALLLLERLQRRLHRRRRLQDRLLLLARLLAIAAVILAAARPQAQWLGGPPTFGGTGNVIVILDDSLSMDQRMMGEPAFALARKDAAAQVRALAPGVRVAVIRTGGTATMLTAGFTADASLAASLVEAVEQSYGGTDLRGAFTLARTTLEGAAGEVLVYTDESGSGVVEACAGDIDRLLELGSSILPRVYGPDERRNVAPVEASYGDGLEGGTVTVTLANWGSADREVPATVHLPDGAQITAFATVPGATDAGPGTVETRFTVPRQAEGGVARVEVDDPDLPLDNARYFHLPRIGASRVLVVDGDPGSTPTRSEVYFLERALAPWAGAGGIAVDVVSPSGLAKLDPTTHRVAFLANVADPAAQAPQLVDFVRRGGGLVIGMGDNVTAERYDSALASLLPAPLRKTRDLVSLTADDGASLRPPDVEGIDLFRVFARAGRESFARVHTRRVMTTDPPVGDDVSVLLTYADGVPALLERRIGNGRVLLWTSTFDLGWTNLPLQAVFMPFVQRLTGYLGGDAGGAAFTADGVVDAPVTLSFPPAGGDPEVTGPDGGIVASERGIGTLGFTPARPGAYAAVPTGLPPLAWVAVNTSASESDVRRGTSLVEAQAEIAPERLRRTFDLDLPLVGAGVALLIGAGLLGRGRSEDA
ncbi:MAG: VWA domain-containing protein [Pseudomonadota bacterium]|nr:VWA domain-containing protein [Pseudomonadota bacterium]